MTRTGATVQSQLALRPGSVTVIAVAESGYAPVDEMMRLLADELGIAIGAAPEYVGHDAAGWQYIIGAGRPVVLRVQPPNDRMRRWLRRTLPGVMSDPIYAAVHVDWRGARETITWPAGVWVVPTPTRAVYGAPNWPDGDAQSQRERLETQGDDVEMVRQARAIQAAMRHVASSLGGSASMVLAGVAAGAIGAWLIRR